MLKLTYHWMTKYDILDVRDIEVNSFTVPWTGDDFRRCLVEPKTSSRLVRHDDRIVGYVVYQTPKRERIILNLAVHPDFRRLGIAKAMLTDIRRRARPAVERITAQVRETNLGAQLFFRDTGFRCTDIIRQPYEDCTEDAYLFEFRPGVPARKVIQKGVCS